MEEGKNVWILEMIGWLDYGHTFRKMYKGMDDRYTFLGVNECMDRV